MSRVILKILPVKATELKPLLEASGQLDQYADKLNDPGTFFALNCSEPKTIVYYVGEYVTVLNSIAQTVAEVAKRDSEVEVSGFNSDVVALKIRDYRIEENMTYHATHKCDLDVKAIDDSFASGYQIQYYTAR